VSEEQDRLDHEEEEQWYQYEASMKELGAESVIGILENGSWNVVVTYPDQRQVMGKGMTRLTAARNARRAMHIDKGMHGG
jgi:hypothetical protein